MPIKNLKGHKFGRLTAIEFVGVITQPAGRQTAGRQTAGYQVSTWKCACECGKEWVGAYSSLISGNTKSCGCLRIEVARKRVAALQAASWKHGLSRTRNYKIWHYAKMQGTLCEKWKNDIVAFDDDMGEGPEGYFLCRYDGDEPHSAENSFWGNKAEALKHSPRNVNLAFNGETMIMSAWARKLKVSREYVRQVHKAGNWPEKFLGKLSPEKQGSEKQGSD